MKMRQCYEGYAMSLFRYWSVSNFPWWCNTMWSDVIRMTYSNTCSTVAVHAIEPQLNQLDRQWMGQTTPVHYHHTRGIFQGMCIPHIFSSLDWYITWMLLWLRLIQSLQTWSVTVVKLVSSSFVYQTIRMLWYNQSIVLSRANVLVYQECLRVQTKTS